MDGALQVIGEKFPPWWGLPALSPSKQLALWFFVLPLVAFGLLVAAITLYRRSAASPRSVVLLSAVAVRRRTAAASLAAPRFGPLSCGSPASPGRWRHWPSIEWIYYRSPRTNPALRTGISVGLIAAATIIIVPFFTFRTYLSQVRQSLSDTAAPGYEVRRDDRFFYLGDERPTLATQAVIDELDRLLGAWSTAARRPGRPAPDRLQRRLLLPPLS